MSVLFGCIADDFTGATDIAGILTRAGVRVNLRIGVPQSRPGSVHEVSPASFEIIALKCRTEPAVVAVQQALDALAWLHEQGATRIFWKYCSTFDSTPKGNIGPVSEALMDVIGTNQTIYCPAFPENGRSIYKGLLFVGDQPLNESPMRDHPLTPMRDANLGRLLEPQVTKSVGNIYHSTVRIGAQAVTDKLKMLASTNIEHVVIDAVDGQDLKTIVEATAQLPLLTGGSALALQLPELYQSMGLLDEDARSTTRQAVGLGQIVLSGSCSEMTQAQVATYKATATSLSLDPILLVEKPETMEKYKAWLSVQAPDAPKIIYATASPDQVEKTQQVLGREKAGEVLEGALAELADVAFAIGIRRFVIAGGETSGAVTQRLGITDLEVGKEIAPGVPWTFCEKQGETTALALKSGNFGDEFFFTKAMSLLEHA